MEKTKTVNPGIVLGTDFIKVVNFSKAVLWKDRELSLPKAKMEGLIGRGIERLIFKDNRKREIWTFDIEKIKENMVLKTEGQEPQYYFSIDLAKITKKGK